MKRKILALLLACMMVISMVPATVLAADEVDTCTCAGKTEPNLQGETPDVLVFTKDSTCEAYGQTAYRCADCEGSIVVLIDPKGHESGVEATCTTAQTCIRCDKVYAPAKGHTAGAAATCTTAQTCTVCGDVLDTAKGHNPGAAADCENDQTCTVCGEVLVGKLGHKPGAAADCENDQTCTVCGEVLVRKLGHKPGAAATCTTAQTCTVCNTVLVKAKGHAYVSKYTEPTCSADGYTTYTCACGDSYEETDKGSKDSVEHTIVYTEGKLPTCVEDGYTYGAKCSVCGKVFTESEKLPADKTNDAYHSWTVWFTVPATCTKGTREQRQCWDCRDVQERNEQNDKEPHNYGELENKPCVDRECVDCGFELDATKEHDYGNLKNAPCVDRECTVCGFDWTGNGDHVYELELPACVPDVYCANCSTKREAEPHTYASNATCIDRTCTVCKSYTLKATTKHTETEFGKEDPTYDKTGMSGYTKCSVCNSALSENKEEPMVAENVTFEYVVEGLSVTTGTITIKVYMVAENGVRIEALQWGMDFDENGLTLTGAKFELANLAGSITAKDTANAKGKVVVSAYSTDKENHYTTYAANKDGYLFATLTFTVNADVKRGTKLKFGTEVVFTRPESFKNNSSFNAGTVETLVVETLGNITGEGDVVDVNDLVVLLRAINAGTELKYEDYKILDMDQSGSVDGADLIKLRNLIAGADADA